MINDDVNSFYGNLAEIINTAERVRRAEEEKQRESAKLELAKFVDAMIAAAEEVLLGYAKANIIKSLKGTYSVVRSQVYNGALARMGTSAPAVGESFYDRPGVDHQIEQGFCDTWNRRHAGRCFVEYVRADHEFHFKFDAR